MRSTPPALTASGTCAMTLVRPTHYHAAVKRDIVIDMRYDYPVALVWRVMATRNGMAAWLMDNDFEPVRGHEFRFRSEAKGAWDGVISCEVRALVPEKRLTYTWNGLWGESLVSWTFREEGKATTVRLEHSGFAGFRGFVLRLMLASGWKRKLTLSVPRLLARSAEQPEAESGKSQAATHSEEPRL